jgi:intein/homing endonuclease
MLIVFYDFISISEFFTNLITNTIYDIDKGFSLRSIFVDVNTIIVFFILAISLIAYLISYGIKSTGNIKTLLLISSILFIAFFINGYYMGDGSALIYLLLPFLVLVTKLIEISNRNWLLDLVAIFIIVFNLINQNLF